MEPVPGTRWLPATQRLRSKERGFVEGETWAELVVFNRKLQAAEGEWWRQHARLPGKHLTTVLTLAAKLTQSGSVVNTGIWTEPRNGWAGLPAGRCQGCATLGGLKTPSVGTAEGRQPATVGALGTEGASSVLPGEEQG